MEQELKAHRNVDMAIIPNSGLVGYSSYPVLVNIEFVHSSFDDVAPCAFPFTRFISASAITNKRFSYPEYLCYFPNEKQVTNALNHALTRWLLRKEKLVQVLFDCKSRTTTTRGRGKL